MSDKTEIAKNIALVAAEYEIQLDAARTRIWLTSLEPFGAEVVARAVQLLFADPTVGRYGKPRINEIIAKCEQVTGGDGHPNADEAWAIAILAADEANTVVWTEEIAGAYFRAASLLSGRGEETAARMAFKAAYDKLVTASRSAGLRTRWSATIGADESQRETALKEAVDAGKLALSWKSPDDVPALPAPSIGGQQVSVEAARAALRDCLAKLEPADKKLERIAEERALDQRLLTAQQRQRALHGVRHE
jgi:hypothetical protein